MSASNWIVFDTEDDSKELLESGKSGFDKQTTQIAAIAENGDRFYNTGQRGEFFNWLNTRKEKYIYAHNCAYDLGNLVADNLDALDTTMVGGRLISARVGRFSFVDSFNLWPMSLKKLGEAFELEKLETGSMATDRDYVYRDCEILHRAMSFVWDFTREIGLSHCPPTLGGLCVKTWKHWGGENIHDSHELAKKAYYGGRVELFKQKSQTPNVCYTDINSLYPYCMLNEFPTALEPWTEDRLPRFGVADVTVKVPKSDYPPLPYRDEDGRIRYPYGKFRGCWTIAELMDLVEHGGEIVKIHDMLGTDDGHRPYDTFVRRLYQMRLDSTSEAEKLFFKLLMNNLYGRLGTSGVISRTVWQNERNRDDGVPYGDKVLVDYAMPLSEETNWCHAAYITAYARLELLRYLRLIGPERMIYCDTDSCIFDSPDRTIPFPIGKQLGQMKLEGWESSAEAWCPKNYRYGSKYKAKGVPQRLAEQYSTTGLASFDLPFKMREAIRFYDRKNSRKLSVWRQVEKRRQGVYDRKILKKGRYFPCKISAVE